MKNNEKVEKLVEYIEQNTKTDGDILLIDNETFASLTGTSSTQALQSLRYGASLNSPDCIVMELHDSGNKLKSRMKMAYGFRKISDIKNYKLSEKNFRMLTDCDIDYIVNKILCDEDKDCIPYTAILPILYYIDIILIKNKHNKWTLVNLRYFTTCFLLPFNIVETYYNKLKENNIIVEKVYGKYTFSRLSLDESGCPEFELSDDIPIIGYNHYAIQKLKTRFSEEKEKICSKNIEASIDNKEKSVIIDTKNTCSENTEDIDRVISEYHKVIREKVKDLTDEILVLKSRIAEYEQKNSEDYNVFQKLSDAYSDINQEIIEIKNTYVSPDSIAEFKIEIEDKIRDVLNKFIVDVTTQCSGITDNVNDINDAKANIMDIAINTRYSIINSIKSSKIQHDSNNGEHQDD